MSASAGAGFAALLELASLPTLLESAVSAAALEGDGESTGFAALPVGHGIAVGLTARRDEERWHKEQKRKWRRDNEA